MISTAEATAIVKRVLRGRRDPELEAAAWRGMQRAIEAWDGERSFGAWAGYVIRGYLANQYRTWRTARHTTGTLDDVSLGVESSDAPRDPMLRRAIQRALGDLPPRQAEAMMHFANGLTEAEAGAEMGIGSPAVNGLVNRARLRLQRSLRIAYLEMTT